MVELPLDHQIDIALRLLPYGSDWIERLDYPQVYLSSEGNVASSRSGSVRILGCGFQGQYRAYISGKPETAKYVHQLVCETFNGLPPSGSYEVRHLDGGKTNNRAGNLCWGTRSENIADKVRHGTDNRGERHANAKLTWAAVSQIRAARSTTGETYKKLAERFGVSVMTAYKAANGESWKQR